MKLDSGSLEPVAETDTAAVWVAIAITVLSLLTSFLIGALAVQIRQDIAFGSAQLGALVGVFNLMAGAVSVPVGRLVERIGARRGVAWSALILGMAGFGLAMLASSWGHLALLLAFAGVGAGMGQPAANLVLARRVNLQRQGLTFGLKQAAVPTATLLAGLAVPLASVLVGWRFIFAVSGVAATVLVCFAGRILPPYESANRDQPAVTEIAVQPLLILAVGGFFGGAAVASLAAFLVESGVARGFGPSRAGVILALSSMAAILTRVGAGWQADRRGRRHLVIVSRLLATGAAGFVLMALTSHGWWFVIGALIGAGAGWGWNGLFHFAVVRNQHQAPAAATSITQTGLFLGAGVGPFAFGAIVELTSYRDAWLVAALWLVFAALLVRLGRWRFQQALSGH